MRYLAYGMFLPLAKRSRDLWNVMCVTAFCYYGGWWIPSRCSDPPENDPPAA
jgi:hypothetical protein